jgi:hypothetical protein
VTGFPIDVKWDENEFLPAIFRGYIFKKDYGIIILL